MPFVKRRMASPGHGKKGAKYLFGEDLFSPPETGFFAYPFFFVKKKRWPAMGKAGGNFPFDIHRRV
jgi:hypothetical protein